MVLEYTIFDVTIYEVTNRLPHSCVSVSMSREEFLYEMMRRTALRGTSYSCLK
jgi:hypothetical protein